MDHGRDNLTLHDQNVLDIWYAAAAAICLRSPYAPVRQELYRVLNTEHQQPE